MLGLDDSLAAAAIGPQSPGKLRTRGIVLVPGDLSLVDWPERAKRVGLTTIALHHGSRPGEVVRFIQSPAGRAFIEQCRRLGLEVEYELHAGAELLPRGLFAKDKSLFRMNDRGERTADANLCVHSGPALEVAAEQAVRWARVLKPTTGRYFFWGDDGQPWCRCPQCRDFSDSDQALTLENHVVHALRDQQPDAQLAHLAYANTLPPPRKVKPAPGIFLEYAPIGRRYDIPYAQQKDSGAPDGLSVFEANLQTFPVESAQVLEYWLDVSKASGWKKPAARLPWHKELFLSDVATYRAHGIQHLTSFAVWIDADYVQRYGEPGFLSEYGKGLTDNS